MKVLHIQKASGVAGSERHLQLLLPALRARAVEVTMCVIVAPGGERFMAALRDVGVPSIELRAGPDVDPMLAPRLLRIIRAEHPGLVHTHLIHADVYGQLAAKVARVPGVRSVHGATPQLRRQPFRGAAALAGRCARRTIAISDYAGRFVAENGLAPAARIRVVPYGIDAAAWIGDESQRAAARTEFGIRDSDVVVGVASRLIAGKGHEFLIAGLDRARQELPSLVALVAGDGPLRPELEARVRAASLEAAVRFLGYMGPDRIGAFMQACDLLAFLTLPSLGEGFGLAALEASAAGRAVLATDVGALPEIVENGSTGVLVAPGDVDRLAAELVRLGRDPDLRGRLGSAAQARARSRYSVAHMVDQTLAVYEEARSRHA